MDGLMGRVVKRDLKLGATVRAGDLEKRIDARRGRPVTLRLNADSLRIQSTGVLQDDADIGSWVVVETESGSELRGLLVAPDVVEVSIGPATGGLR
jgi:flagella basal body P-ring formation protein FlgA